MKWIIIIFLCITFLADQDKLASLRKTIKSQEETIGYLRECENEYLRVQLQCTYSKSINDGLRKEIERLKNENF